MEILLFTLNAIVIYLLSDWMLRSFEARRGVTIKYRQVVFFVVFLSLAMLTFRLLRVFLST